MFFHDPLIYASLLGNKIITINFLEDKMASIWRTLQKELAHIIKRISTAKVKLESPVNGNEFLTC